METTHDLALPMQAFAEQLEVLMEEAVPVFSFTFGVPAERDIQRLHDNGITVLGTATTVAEAIELEMKGVDGIVAQGSEAGGHRGTFLQDPSSRSSVHSPLFRRW